MPNETVQIAELSGRAITRLQSWAVSLGATAETSSLTLVPPGLGDDVRILAVSCVEWFAISDTLGGPTLHERLWRYAANQDIAAVDLTCAVKVLRVEGAAARRVLAQGCGLDLHPQGFPAGRAVRTRFAQLSVIVHCIDPRSRFDLYVGRSYETYLRSWLLDCYPDA